MTWWAPVTAAATAPASSISSWTTRSGRHARARGTRSAARAVPVVRKYSGESAARPPAAACVGPDRPRVEATPRDVRHEVGTGRDHDVVTGPPGRVGERQQRVHVAVHRPGAEEDPHADDRDASERPRCLEMAWRSRRVLAQQGAVVVVLVLDEDVDDVGTDDVVVVAHVAGDVVVVTTVVVAACVVVVGTSVVVVAGATVVVVVSTMGVGGRGGRARRACSWSSCVGGGGRSGMACELNCNR